MGAEVAQRRMAEQILRLALAIPLRFSCATILVAISCRRPVRKSRDALPRGETAAMPEFSHLFFQCRIPPGNWRGLAGSVGASDGACSGVNNASLAGSVKWADRCQSAAVNSGSRFFIRAIYARRTRYQQMLAQGDDSCAGHASSFANPA